MKFTLCSNWLRERAGWGYLARSGTITFSGKKRVLFWPYNKSKFTDQVLTNKQSLGQTRIIMVTRIALFYNALS